VTRLPARPWASAWHGRSMRWQPMSEWTPLLSFKNRSPLMLTIRDILRQRRHQLLDFFSWRFGTANYTAALAYCTGLCRGTISTFRRREVPFGSLLLIEDAALHLGFRPPRTVARSGKFTKPRSLKLPRWSDPATRIRFYQWQRDLNRAER